MISFSIEGKHCVIHVYGIRNFSIIWVHIIGNKACAAGVSHNFFKNCTKEHWDMEGILYFLFSQVGEQCIGFYL